MQPEGQFKVKDHQQGRRGVSHARACFVRSDRRLSRHQNMPAIGDLAVAKLDV